MNKKPYVVAINAISGGGKTTITKKLQEELPNASALFFDDRDYDTHSGIDDICKWIENGADVNAFNLNLLAEDLEKMISEHYDFIILDYPFSYRHSLISKYIDYSVFIDTPLDIALARRIIRDYTSDNISNIFNDMNQYMNQGRNAYLSSLNLSKLDADLIIDGCDTLDVIVDSIKNNLINNIILMQHNP